MIERKLKLVSTPGFYAPGMFRWVREAVAPFNRTKAAQFLRGFGLGSTDAKFLANPKSKVKTTKIDDEDLLLEFSRPTKQNHATR